jgi:predicted transglutaminase-like cysteine proteinase
MRGVAWSLSAFLAVMLTCSTSAAVEQAPAGLLSAWSGPKHIGTSRPALAPLGYVRYCRSNPADCRGSEAADLELDIGTFLLLDRVNEMVNRSIEPVPEDVDDWVGYTSAGDCEDFALLKRTLLLRAGLPAGALRIAVAETQGGEPHAVLVVRSSEGDLVLDNLTDDIVAWNEAQLAWRKIASEANPRLWFAIDIGM